MAGTITRQGYWRKGYRTATGKYVARAWVPPARIKDRGRKGKGPKVIPKLKRGGLGGPGFLERAAQARRAILARVAKRDGWATAERRLGVLLVLGKRTWPKAKLETVRSDLRWLRKNRARLNPGSKPLRPKRASIVRRRASGTRRRRLRTTKRASSSSSTSSSSSRKRSGANRASSAKRDRRGRFVSKRRSKRGKR